MLLPQEEIPGSGIYRLYEADEEKELDIVLFHGLERRDSRNAYKTTWQTEVKNRKVLWPGEWLGKEDNNVHRVLSVSYNSPSITNIEHPTVELIVDELLRLLVNPGGVGQERGVILVGHGLGGLIIQMICRSLASVDQEDPASKSCLPRPDMIEMYKMFRKNIHGIFLYGAPLIGSWITNLLYKDPVMRALAKYKGQETLSKDFNIACQYFQWQTMALVEDRKSTWCKVNCIHP